MRDRIKVVFVGFLTGYGGAEKSMINIANELANFGFDVSIISLKDNNTVYKINKNVSYIFIPEKGKSNFGKKFYRFKNLKSKLSEIKPNVVISFWLQPAIYTSVISKFMGFKTIYSERGDPSDKEYDGLLGFLRSISFKLIDGFVFQTEGAKNYFSKSIQNKSTVINNPVFIKDDDFCINRNRRKTIVNVGRLHPQKNQTLLIHSFAKISKIFPDYTLEIYGSGELENELICLIKKLELEGKVFLKGTTDQLYSKIVDATLFVLSSDYEGMPNALMEAMALGIPCVTTDCRPGGARELIVNGESGLIVNRNSVDYLVDAIKFMLENPTEAERMAKNAKKICETHSVENIINLWASYISKVLKG